MQNQIFDPCIQGLQNKNSTSSFFSIS